MASMNTYGGPGIPPKTYPNKPGGSAGKAASFAGKHARAMGHVADGMKKAEAVAKKSRGH